MKQRFLVAAIAAGVAGTAGAQSSVQVYGVMDGGIEHVTHAGASGGSSTRVSSGGSNNSRFGFRGSEDLGGGLKAIFNLEGGILIDNGTSDGALFRRQANVGLEGKLGRVVLGRSWTTVYDFVNPFDPMGYAPRYSWVPTGGGTLASKYGMTTGYDNMVKYQGTFGGFKLGASFGAGEASRNNADGRKLAVGAVYDKGPLRFVATAERVNGLPNATTGDRSDSKVFHAATSYEVNDGLDLKLGVRHYKLERTSAGDVRANTWWAGANYALTPVVDFTGAVYYQDIKNGLTASDTAADPMMFVLRTRYTLSKRTNLYATLAHAKAKGGVAVGLTRDSSDDGGVTGQADRQSGVMLGIQHRF